MALSMGNVDLHRDAIQDNKHDFYLTYRDHWLLTLDQIESNVIHVIGGWAR